MAWEFNQATNTATDSETGIKVTGVKSANGLSLSGTVVTVAKSALNGTDISITGGTLALGSDVVTPNTTTTSPTGWSQSGDTATYKGKTVTESYALEGGKIAYKSEEKDVSIEVRGINDTNALELSNDGTTVTVSKRALGGSNVTINDGYNLALGSDVYPPEGTEAKWSYSSGTATYTPAQTSSGYTLTNNRLITYTARSEGDPIEIDGVRSSEGIAVSLDGSQNMFILSASALNKEKVSVTNEEYKLVLGEDVATPVNTAEGWTLEGQKATYKTKSATEGYVVTDENEIEYSAEIKASVVVEVNGVKDTKGLTLVQNEEENAVAVYSSALDPANTVTVSDGFELELGSDVEVSTIFSGYWTPNGNNWAYRINETTKGYRVIDNQISYTTSVEGGTLAEFSGIATNSTPVVPETYDVISFTPDNFAGNVAVVSSSVGNFEFTEGDYGDKSFTASENIDNITNVGSKIVLNGGAGADKFSNTGSDVTVSGGEGDDNVTINASVDAGNNNVFSYSSGDGNDIIYNFDASDKIQFIGFTSESTLRPEENVKNKDVIFKVGNGTVTVRDAAEKELTITLVGSQENDILSSHRYTTNGITRGYTIELAQTLKDPYTQENNISVVDGSKVKDGAYIIGNDNSEGGSLIGGDGKDTLISGQNNFELTGGKGNDLFVFGGGNDTIYDYSQKGTDGSDRISLGSFEETDYEIDGDDVILSYGDNDSITIVDGKGKEITFADKKSIVKVYGDEGVFDGKRKSLILARNTENAFSAAKYSKMETIDGSAVVNEITITGNKKANVLIAGSVNTTLNGGKGKDTLVGGDAIDTFIYENKSGNKTIQNYNYGAGQGDIVSLGGDAEISSVTTKKDNVILKVGSNTITIEGMAKSQFTFIQGGESKIYDNERLVSADGKSATLSSDFKGAFDLTSAAYAQYANVSAELGKKSVSLIGDADDNVLIGGAGKDTLNGRENSDTLNGGKGNDVLWGGEDADTFIYVAGQGTDTIMDYNFDEGDILQILDKRGRVITKDAIKKWDFDGDDCVLSIKGGGKVVLADVGTSVKISANGNELSF